MLFMPSNLQNVLNNFSFSIKLQQQFIFYYEQTNSDFYKLFKFKFYRN